jgi:DHA1 family bicyclomycin/chloramphenicol resistance-like MFS transporter
LREYSRFPAYLQDRREVQTATGASGSPKVVEGAFATLVYGSISDRLGRRAVLIGGLVVFIAGSALCALSDGIAGLIVGRLLQAVGAACGLILAHDIFGTGGSVRIFAYLPMAYSLGPMIAPPIGGVLVHSIGWRAIFASAALAVALFLVLVIFVPELHRRPQPESLK